MTHNYDAANSRPKIPEDCTCDWDEDQITGKRYITTYDRDCPHVRQIKSLGERTKFEIDKSGKDIKKAQEFKSDCLKRFSKYGIKVNIY